MKRLLKVLVLIAAACITLLFGGYKIFRKVHATTYSVGKYAEFLEDTSKKASEKAGEKLNNSSIPTKSERHPLTSDESPSSGSSLTYTDIFTGEEITRKEPIEYLNADIGKEIKIDAGYVSQSCIVSVIPEYENGLIYGDGTQEPYNEELVTYIDPDNNLKWYTKSVYHYKGCNPGEEITITPKYGNPKEVKIRFVPEYTEGLIYPDGTQEKCG